MSELNPHSLELSTMQRSESANRFQVNPVNHSANGTSRDHEDDDDTFNENEAEMMTKRRTSRIQSIKTSFKLDKNSKKEAQARFKAGGDDSSDSNEDESLLDGQYDTKYGRSFRLVELNLIFYNIKLNVSDRHFTREALPRLDNYRNILSIQAQYRPTLDELHNATIMNKVSI